MSLKYTLYTIGGSLIGIILLLFFIYDFHMSILNVSDSLFVVGSTLFFIGILKVTGAGQIFDSSRYLTHKMFARNDDSSFKTFGNYKEYLQQKIIQRNGRYRGLTLVSVGGVYIIISLTMGFIK